MTAQDLYRAMLRDDVAPRLRVLGGKGSGNRFELPNPRAWVQLGFQLSRRNTATELSFTLNVSVVDRVTWAALRADLPALPSRPNPAHVYGRDVRPIRTGELLDPDHGRDTWWFIAVNRAAEQTGPIANGVVSTVSDFAMPEIMRLTGGDV